MSNLCVKWLNPGPVCPGLLLTVVGGVKRQAGEQAGCSQAGAGVGGSLPGLPGTEMHTLSLDLEAGPPRLHRAPVMGRQLGACWSLRNPPEEFHLLLCHGPLPRVSPCNALCINSLAVSGALFPFSHLPEEGTEVQGLGGRSETCPKSHGQQTPSLALFTKQGSPEKAVRES